MREREKKIGEMLLICISVECEERTGRKQVRQARERERERGIERERENIKSRFAMPSTELALHYQLLNVSW